LFLSGGLLLAMIEGVGIMFTRFTAEQFNPGNLPLFYQSCVRAVNIFLSFVDSVYIFLYDG